ncbi:MAG: hypothetical protein IJ598_05960 [Ruminococcus sp.]|nr:hypothetical protein [Ruminococcus sp.]
MKKSKVILAIALAVVIVITCVSVPTFSWFTRPQSQSGKEMELQTKNTYTAYNGKNVTISTKSSATGVEDSYTTDANNDNDCSGVAVTPYNRRYFCTTITNASTTVQNVSLYARTLSIPTASSNGTLALGVNAPTRSYHDYSTLAAQTTTITRDSMRIYFQKPKVAPDGWTGTEFYICWGDNLNATGSNGTYYHMSYCGEKDGCYNYYADIPMTAQQAFFACENWGENKKVEDYTADNWKRRTQTMQNLFSDGQSQLQSVVYKLSNSIEGGNTKIENHYNVNSGACINHYYSSIFVTTGSTYDASLSNTNNIPVRIGYSANNIGNLEYTSGDESVFTVGKTTGIITPVGAGEATLYTKAIGSYFSDEQQVETTIKVTATDNYVFNDVPIVKNIQLPVDNSETEDKNEGEIKIYWYVINNSPSNNLTYTIDNIYLSL